MHDDSLAPALQAPLRRAAAELQRQAPDSEQDARVLARLQQLLAMRAPALALAPAGPGATPRLLRGAAWSGAALALLALLMAATVLVFDPPRLAPPANAWADATTVVDSGFVPVVSQAQWQRLTQGAAGRAGGSAVWPMPAEMPRERLALLGLPYDTSRADSRVRTELMVDPGSGQLLAVRFLQ